MLHHDILTITETAALLRMSAKTLRILVADNKVPGKRVGNRWLFHREIILEFIRNGHKAIT
jgi:excisionase family DNA binding protein